MGRAQRGFKPGEGLHYATPAASAKQNDFETNALSQHLKTAIQVLTIESNALQLLAQRVDESFNQAVELILQSRGRVIICGMGKSGIIGKKISATLASTGTQSFFMHPGEAYHGDLGMVDSHDIFVAISYSGETEEVIKLLPFLKSNHNVVIAITGNDASTLASHAEVHLNVQVEKEACPLQLAPTASTTATLAMGDALAVALMEARDFQAENFARFHPGGSLGRRLLCRVKDEMISDNLPLVGLNSSAKTVISIMTQRGLGLSIVVDEETPLGIITDGDLRRAMDTSQRDFFDLKAEQMMTRAPKTIAADTSMMDALDLMKRTKVHSLLVCEQGKLLGVVNE